MNLHDNKSQENESRAIANNDHTQKTTTPVAQFVDNRPEAVAQLKLQEGIKESSGTEPVQMMEGDETEAPALQGGGTPNNTGLPDDLKAGIEKLSGLSMDDVKVHYGSGEPEQLGALAYAQGTDIYIGPGQEEHLAHEAWHVVQQKEGRVAKTMQLKGGVGVNDDSGLEKEADVMGEKALEVQSLQNVSLQRKEAKGNGTIQRVTINLDPNDKAISDSAQIHKARDDRFSGTDTPLITGDFDPTGTLPLSTINLDEEITILAHGTPEMGGDVPRVAGKTAQELFDHLVSMGLTPLHTGTINLSNCTSAWDRKGTGSFLDLFVKILKSNGFSNYVTGYESFTESVDIDTELEVPQDKREIFLAHKIAERFLMKLMNILPKDAETGAIHQFHQEVYTGAKFADNEARDFLVQDDLDAQKLGKFYLMLSQELKNYLAAAEDKYNEKAILAFQINTMDLMKKFEFDNLGLRLLDQKVEAIPVLSGVPMI